MQYILRLLPRRNRVLGATLVEALTTLGIAGLLSAMAMPMLGDLVTQYRESSMAHAFSASVYRARSEAILRNARVVLCKSANGLTCSAAGGWESGWIIFHDANNNANLDAEEALLQVQLFSASRIRFSGNEPVARYISFNGLGLPKKVTGEFQAGTLTLCSQSAGKVVAREMVLSKPGNLRSSKTLATHCAWDLWPMAICSPRPPAS